jgi:hypothetical protein
MQAIPQLYPLWAVSSVERNPKVRPVIGWTPYGIDRWLPIVAGYTYAAAELRLEIFTDQHAAEAYARAWRDRLPQ